MDFARPSSVARAGLQVLVRRTRDGVLIADPDRRIPLTDRRGLDAATSGERITDLADTLRMFTPHGRPYSTQQWPVRRSITEIYVDAGTVAAAVLIECAR